MKEASYSPALSQSWERRGAGGGGGPIKNAMQGAGRSVSLREIRRELKRDGVKYTQNIVQGRYRI